MEHEKPENFHKLSSSKLIHSIVLRDKPVKNFRSWLCMQTFFGYPV
jgi:hypothetical protein